MKVSALGMRRAACALMVVTGLFAAASSVGAQGNSIESVDVATQAGGTTVVRVGLKEAPNNPMARALVARFDSVDQVRFTNSGSEADLMAVLTARHVTGRDRVVVVARGSPLVDHAA